VCAGVGSQSISEPLLETARRRSRPLGSPSAWVRDPVARARELRASSRCDAVRAPHAERRGGPTPTRALAGMARGGRTTRRPSCSNTVRKFCARLEGVEPRPCAAGEPRSGARISYSIRAIFRLRRSQQPASGADGRSRMRRRRASPAASWPQERSGRDSRTRADAKSSPELDRDGPLRPPSPAPHVTGRALPGHPMDPHGTAEVSLSGEPGAPRGEPRDRPGFWVGCEATGAPRPLRWARWARRLHPASVGHLPHRAEVREPGTPPPGRNGAGREASAPAASLSRSPEAPVNAG